MRRLVAALGLWAGVASASDAELSLEQAKAAVAADATDRAMELAIRAALDGADPFDARRVYLEAAGAAGLGQVAEAALEVSPDPEAAVAVAWSRIDRGVGLADPAPLGDGEAAALTMAWAAAREGRHELALQRLPDAGAEAARLRLRALQELDRRAPLRREARAAMRRHPRHPELLGELWRTSDPRGLRAIRRRALRQVEVLAGSDDPVVLFRALQVAVAAGEAGLSTEIARRLEAAGHLRPPDRRRFGAAMLRHLGEALGSSDPIALPWLRPSEAPGLVEAVHDTAARRGRGDLALELWDRLPPELRTWEVAMAHGRLAADLGQPRQALRFAELAQAAAAAPAWNDRARLDGARQARELAEALGLEAEAQFELGRGTAALARAWLAHQLDPDPRWAAMWLRAQLAVGPAPRDRALFDLVAAADPNDDHAAGLAEAALRQAARMDADRTTGDLDDTLSALVLRALAERSLVDATVVSLLAPDRAAPWRLRAVLAEQRNQGWIAFAAYAMARSLGADADADVERTWGGLGDARAAAVAAVGRWHASFAERSRTHRDAPEPPEHPTLGRTMPPWSAGGLDGGTVASRDLAGRPYVLAVWASWCGPCRAELPAIAEVAGSLAEEGIEVPVIAVSVDEDRADALRTARRERWRGLTLGWTDRRRGPFGATALPTTWVVAADGTLVHVQTGFEEGFAARLERILRQYAD